MEWLRLVIGILGLILVLQLVQLFRFNKDLNKQITNEWRLSRNFRVRWDERFSRITVTIFLQSFYPLFIVCFREPSVT